MKNLDTLAWWFTFEPASRSTEMTSLPSGAHSAAAISGVKSLTKTQKQILNIFFVETKCSFLFLLLFDSPSLNQLQHLKEFELFSYFPS